MKKQYYLRTPGDHKNLAIVEDRKAALAAGFTPLTIKSGLRAFLKRPYDFISEPASYGGINYTEVFCVVD